MAAQSTFSAPWTEYAELENVPQSLDETETRPRLALRLPHCIQTEFAVITLVAFTTEILQEVHAHTWA